MKSFRLIAFLETISECASREKMERLHAVVEMLANEACLAEKYKDHALSGTYQGFRECHIQPDWLLIYKKENDLLVLSLTRTGSHSDLLQK